MSDLIRIAIDAMSGDFGPRTAMSAALKAVDKYPDLVLTLVGYPAALSGADEHPQINIVSAFSVVSMEDDPAHSLRHKRDSSMAVALQAVSLGEADACVSAGNTGALVALGRYFVKVFAGVSTPAICKSMPSRGRPCFMLDLGANADVEAVKLAQFARMGAVLARAHGVLGDPEVALLNVGGEGGKGPELVRDAAGLVEGMPGVVYRGFIEADRLLCGDVDVVVCDGFSGNVALKACEGTARYIAGVASEDLSGSVVARLRAILAWPLLSRWRKKFNPARYNGAILLGLRGVVVKSHGSAGELAFLHAIEVAKAQVQAGLVARLESEFGVCQS